MYCHFYKKEGIMKSLAIWHLTNENIQSCEMHKPKLQELIDVEKRISSDDPSEADYQTWMRL